jgi:hypothetical protein
MRSTSSGTVGRRRFTQQPSCPNERVRKAVVVRNSARNRRMYAWFTSTRRMASPRRRPPAAERREPPAR